MKLIHFPGLNCFSDSIVTLAAFCGIDYSASFSALWSETDLSYDDIHSCYLTRRMPAALASMGLVLSAPPCRARDDREALLAPLREGEFVLAEMDAFDIPWSPVYQALHDSHYFLARREDHRLFSCFDATYQLQGMTLTHDALLQDSLELRRFTRTAGVTLPAHPVHEARALLRDQPRFREELLAALERCALDGRARAVRLARYIDALTKNRRLFLHYLGLHAPNALCLAAFDRDFFSRWEAVKNGLYKAALKEHNTALLGDVRALLLILMEEELAVATKMAAQVEVP